MSEVQLPHNLDAEKTVLGAVLVDGSLWRDVVSAVTREEFFSERNRRIFDALGRIAKRDAAIDVVMLKNEVAKVGALEACGGVAYISALTDGLPRVTNVTDWCVILKDLSSRRRLIAEGHRIAKSAQDGEIDPEAILSAARAAMDGVQKGCGTKLRPLWEGVRGAVGDLDRFDSGDFTDRVWTGIPKLDRRLRGGLAAERMYLICAPSGGGKTTLALQLVASAAELGPVLLVSPEMNLESLVTREIVKMSRCPEWDRNPWVANEARKMSAQERHAAAASRILQQKRPIMVLDDSGATMDGIEAAAESMISSGLTLVMIDYAQEVAATDGKKQRYLQVGEVAQRAVAMSRRLKIPVAVASQVNVVKDGDRKEYTARESKILEQKADTMLVIETNWRDEIAGGDAFTPREVESAYIVCTKQRGGAMFRLRVNYQPDIFLIEDYEEPRHETFAGAFLPPVIPGD